MILQELRIGQIDVLDDGRIIWPNSPQEQLEQNIRGVVVLYDVKNRPSFLSIKKIISKPSSSLQELIELHASAPLPKI